MKRIKKIFKIFSVLCLFNAALFVSCANSTGDVTGDNNQTNQNSGTSGGSNESGGNSTGGGVILKAEVAVAQEALLQAEHPVEAQANQAQVEAVELAVLVHQEAQAVELEAAEALAQAVKLKP